MHRDVQITPWKTSVPAWHCVQAKRSSHHLLWEWRVVSWELESFAVTCDLGRVSLLHFPFPQIPFSTKLLREETSGSVQQIVDRSTYLLVVCLFAICGARMPNPTSRACWSGSVRSSSYWQRTPSGHINNPAHGLQILYHISQTKTTLWLCGMLPAHKS